MSCLLSQEQQSRLQQENREQKKEVTIKNGTWSPKGVLMSLQSALLWFKLTFHMCCYLVPGGTVKFYMFVMFVQLSVPNRMHS